MKLAQQLASVLSESGLCWIVSLGQCWELLDSYLHIYLTCYVVGFSCLVAVKVRNKKPPILIFYSWRDCIKFLWCHKVGIIRFYFPSMWKIWGSELILSNYSEIWDPAGNASTTGSKASTVRPLGGSRKILSDLWGPLGILLPRSAGNKGRKCLIVNIRNSISDRVTALLSKEWLAEGWRQISKR